MSSLSKVVVRLFLWACTCDMGLRGGFVLQEIQVKASFLCWQLMSLTHCLTQFFPCIDLRQNANPFEWEIDHLCWYFFFRLKTLLYFWTNIILCGFRDRLEGWVSPGGSPFVRVWIWCYCWCRWPEKHIRR